MRLPAGSCLSPLAMAVMLSLPLFCTPSMSTIQTGLTWHTVGGVWVLLRTTICWYQCCSETSPDFSKRVRERFDSETRFEMSKRGTCMPNFNIQARTARDQVEVPTWYLPAQQEHDVW